jgi:hypothetical protein
MVASALDDDLCRGEAVERIAATLVKAMEIVLGKSSRRVRW